MANDIYICYSKNDQEIAYQVCNFLEENNFKCWVAPRDVKGGNLAKEILDAISGSQIVVLIFSSSNSSRYLLEEIGNAFIHNKPIIAVSIDDMLLEGELEFYLKNAVWVVATPNDSFYDDLLDCVSNFIVPVEDDGLRGGVAKQPGKASSSEIYEVNDLIYLSYDERDYSDVKMFEVYNSTNDIDKSSLCAVFVSRNSVKSCVDDIEKAFMADVPVILIYLEDVKLKFGLAFKIKYNSKIDKLSDCSIRKYQLDEDDFVESYVKLFKEFGF